jgi:hypothetical protein
VSLDDLAWAIQRHAAQEDYMRVFMTPSLFSFLIVAIGQFVLPVAANEMAVAYEVDQPSPEQYDVYVRLSGYDGESRRFIAACRKVHPSGDGLNPYIANLDCDGRTISIHVVETGIAAQYADVSSTVFVLNEGAHSLNGSPFWVELPEPQIISAPTSKLIKHKD